MTRRSQLNRKASKRGKNDILYLLILVKLIFNLGYFVSSDVIGSLYLGYLTIILRGHAGYEVLDKQPGA